MFHLFLSNALPNAQLILVRGRVVGVVGKHVFFFWGGGGLWGSPEDEVVAILETMRRNGLTNTGSLCRTHRTQPERFERRNSQCFYCFKIKQDFSITLN